MGKKSVEPIPQSSAEVLNLPVPPLRKAEEYLKAYQSYPYAAINAIAQEVANIDLHLYKRRYARGKVVIEEVFEHEALSLLYEVNPYMTSYQLKEITQIYLELTGEAFWALLRNKGGKIEQIWPLRPDWVTVQVSGSVVSGYEYRPSGVPKGAVLKPEDIIPFKYPNPLNPHRGKGAIQAAAMALDTDQFAAEWNRNFYFNSALPYAIFRSKKSLNETQLKRFMEQWNSTFQGRERSHKMAVLTGDWEDPFLFGDKFKDMDFLEQRRLSRDEILATFRVGKSSLNITEDVNRANAEASNVNFMERVVTPKDIRFVSHLNEFYLKNWPDEDLFFDFTDPAPQDVELELKIYENGKNYWLTPNEIRARQNLPPLDGGDTIFMPFSVQPMESLMGAMESAADAVKRFLTGKSVDKQSGVVVMENKAGLPSKKFHMPIPPKKLSQIRREEIKKGIVKDLRKDLTKLVVNLMKAQAEEGEKKNKGRSNWSEDYKDAHWQKMVAKTDVLERRLKELTKNLFLEQEAEVKSNISNTLKHMVRSRTKDKAATFLFNMINENKKWRSVLGPFIKNIVQDKGREVLDFLGIPGEIDLSQQAAATYLKMDGVAFIKQVNETTAEALKETLKQGLINEESIDALSSRVSDVYDIARGSRAIKISRTEVLRSTNFATQEAYRQSNVVEGKEWLTAQDERTCPECEPMDGEETTVNGEFKGGISYPPLHPNCRCTIIPIVKNIQAEPAGPRNADKE